MPTARPTMTANTAVVFVSLTTEVRARMARSVTATPAMAATRGTNAATNDANPSRRTMKATMTPIDVGVGDSRGLNDLSSEVHAYPGGLRGAPGVEEGVDGCRRDVRHGHRVGHGRICDPPRVRDGGAEHELDLRVLA